MKTNQTAPAKVITSQNILDFRGNPYITLRGKKVRCVAYDEHENSRFFGISFAKSICQSVTGWAQYAEEYFHFFGARIGNDGFLGKHWQAQGEALLGLLNGELGGLDAGSLSQNIREFMEQNGFSDEQAADELFKMEVEASKDESMID